MASSATTVQPDTPITIKVNYDGSNKRVKLPFSDLAAGTFEDKLRAALSMPASISCHFERYSDSAGRFVVLDRNNTSVYKQLLRAAKAKQKLKLRVVPAEAAPPAADAPLSHAASVKSGPRPVTIEDVPESASSSDQESMQAKLRRLSLLHHGSVETIVESIVEASANAAVRTERSAAAGPSKGKNPESAATPDQTAPKASSPSSTAAVPTAAPSKPVVASSEMAQRKPAAELAAQCQPGTACPFAQQFSDLASAKKQVAFSGEGVEAPSVPDVRSDNPAPFNVHCNSCSTRIPNTHYHCSKCEEDDFDLCQDCIDRGITCYGADHWLIRRNIQNGLIVRSTTERLPPKHKPAKPVKSELATKPADADAARAKNVARAAEAEAAEAAASSGYYCDFPLSLHDPAASPAAALQAAATKAFAADTTLPSLLAQFRTCNNCISELPEADFLHCSVCFDFDLCQDCFIKNDHGHHPKHAFAPAVKGTVFGWNVSRLLPAGRGEQHNAVCDGCEKFIVGVRHKCLNCPDWDYCSDCVPYADFVHPGHRFIPVYEAASESATGKNYAEKPVVHNGIFCDGPHCAGDNRKATPIAGVRFKCAVCNNKDFCASCEASPANFHNRSHPMLKFQTPVRHVSVTTTGEQGNGTQMPVMGDSRAGSSRPRSQATQSDADSTGNIQVNKVRTIINVKPSGATKASSSSSRTSPPSTTGQNELITNVLERLVDEIVARGAAESAAMHAAKPAAAAEPAAEPAAEKLDAMFQGDTIADGTVFPANYVFEQTWILRNTGSVAWPAGCCVRFVSGDYMGHVDPNHPAGIQELVSASESTVCYTPLAPGGEFPFTVLLRSPSRPGKVISYWRLTTKGGIKFGDRLWCDVDVLPKEETMNFAGKAVSTVAQETSAESSQMIFPKLDKESPVSSIHEPEMSAEVGVGQAEEQSEFGDWADDDDSETGLLTDEEYDILDASDEEFATGEPAKTKA